MKGALQDRGIGPNLGFGGSTPGSKSAHHGPFVTANLDLVTNLQAGELVGGAHSNDDFVSTRFEPAPLNDFEPFANQKSLLLDTAQRHIGVGSGGTLGQI